MTTSGMTMTDPLDGPRVTQGESETPVGYEIDPAPRPTPYTWLHCDNPKCRRELFPVYLDHWRNTFVIWNGKPEKHVRRVLCTACVTYRRFVSVHIGGDGLVEVDIPEENTP